MKKKMVLLDELHIEVWVRPNGEYKSLRKVLLAKDTKQRIMAALMVVVPGLHWEDVEIRVTR